jgi:hypothetical protein
MPDSERIKSLIGILDQAVEKRMEQKHEGGSHPGSQCRIHFSDFFNLFSADAWNIPP